MFEKLLISLSTSLITTISGCRRHLRPTASLHRVALRLAIVHSARCSASFTMSFNALGCYRLLYHLGALRMESLLFFGYFQFQKQSDVESLLICSGTFFGQRQVLLLDGASPYDQPSDPLRRQCYVDVQDALTPCDSYQDACFLGHQV